LDDLVLEETSPVLKVNTKETDEFEYSPELPE